MGGRGRAVLAASGFFLAGDEPVSRCRTYVEQGMAVSSSSLGYVRSMSDWFAVDWSPQRELVKRVFDCLLTGVLMLLFLPVMLVCVAITRMSSPGPVLLRQTRLGKNGQPFQMLKLRTMHADAEADSGPVRAAHHDQRVLPACRWMRRSHLDEIPQLVNVLLGEMSLVGPRPERPEIALEIYHRLPEFRHRLQVRPGITGLAQVRNGYDTCMDAVRHKLQYDLEYIRRRSWLLEMDILLRTLTKFYDPSAR
jgi:lipopolysaccharide/colanic/teichoic acid biosynthesis glycosyltransferase